MNIKKDNSKKPKEKDHENYLYLEDSSPFSSHLQAFGKLNYVKGQKPKIDCILCGVRDNDPRVKSFILYRNSLFFITLNLYPYNPGHLMIVPTRHVERFGDLTKEERTMLFDLIIQAQNLLNDVLSPTGFNVGYNEGKFSGASISHIHVHVVPRYPSELGFIDIIGQSRVVVEGVHSLYPKLKKVALRYFNEDHI